MGHPPRPALFNHSPAHHHPIDLLKHCRIAKRIAIDRDDVSRIARRKATDLVFEAEHSSCNSGGSSKRSEEHTSELQSLMRISYAVFCLKKKTNKTSNTTSDTENKK